MEEVLNSLLLLGEKNGTSNLVDATWEFIKDNLYDFSLDYNNTSRKKRRSTGKLESHLFRYLASICRYENGNDNATIASEIMIAVGYNSYAEKPNRFRQKVENFKKAVKNGKKTCPDLKPRKRRTSRIDRYPEFSASDCSEHSVDSDNNILSLPSIIQTSPIENDPTLVSDIARDVPIINLSLPMSPVLDYEDAAAWRRLDDFELHEIIEREIGCINDEEVNPIDPLLYSSPLVEDTFLSDFILD